MSEQQYLDLLQEVLDNGVRKNVYGHEDVYILSVFGRMLRFYLGMGFPIYTTKKVFYRGAIEEMLWFIRGEGNVADLHRKGVTIWDEWGVKHWNKKYGADLKLSEYQIAIENGLINSHIIPLHYTNSTNWNGLDQTKWVIDSIRKNPDRKSYIVSYWNPSTTYSMADKCGNESVVLPACHYSYQVVVNDGRLSLMVNIRSNDLPVGNPFNVAQYAALTHMYAHCTGYEPGELVISIGDAHVYSNQIDAVKEQLTRQPRYFPTLKLKDRGQQYLQDFNYSDFEIIGYKPHPALKMELTVVGGY